ncbi:hypothetical protein JOB18_007012 [Solea senegalensis]|uniref:Uncharacterized protein n=1 Tax=Solea senegalensis TaxID=28829 RepID=A0AAV6R3N6_SOLSE|nr:hypothetical protein JOB18_007012 [Solea senegalensis]
MHPLLPWSSIILQGALSSRQDKGHLSLDTNALCTTTIPSPPGDSPGNDLVPRTAGVSRASFSASEKVHQLMRQWRPLQMGWGSTAVSSYPCVQFDYVTEIRTPPHAADCFMIK